MEISSDNVHVRRAIDIAYEYRSIEAVLTTALEAAFLELAASYPEPALRFLPGRVAQYPSLFETCVAAAPDAALLHAQTYLSKEQIDACIDAAPWAALHVMAASMTDEQFKYCASKCRPLAMMKAPSRYSKLFPKTRYAKAATGKVGKAASASARAVGIKRRMAP